MNKYFQRTTCRICDCRDLVKILDLGKTPPANAYISSDKLSLFEEEFPLALYFCKNCTLVQVLDVVDPSLLFGDYHFITAASSPSVEHFKKYAQMVVERFIESPENLVIDIGGNDGVLLSYIKDYASVINIDPADNLKPLSEEKGVPMFPAFFTSDVAKKVRQEYGEARVVTAKIGRAHV